MTGRDGVTPQGLPHSSTSEDRSPKKFPHPRAALPFRLLTVLWVIVPAALVVVACRQGVALDWDAVVYLSAADSYADTGRLIDFRGRELTTFAPGLPMLVGTLFRAGIDVETIGRALGVSALVATLLCTYVVARQVVSTVRLGWAAVAVVGLSVSTIRVFAYLKTEALFSALVMSALALGLLAVRRQRTPPWWVVSIAVVVSAATTVRYIGFTLIPMAALAAALASRNRGMFVGVRSVLITGFSASVGLGLVAVRNLHLGSDPLGPRAPSGLTVSSVVTDTLSVLGSYLVPFDSSSTVRMWCGIVAVGLVALGGVVACRRRSMPGVYLGIFICGYLATLIYSEFATVIQPVNERLLAPVLPAMVVLAILGLSRPAGRPDHAYRGVGLLTRVRRLVAWCVLIFMLTTSSMSSVAFALETSRSGLGYNSRSSRDSPTAQAVLDLPADAGLAAMNGPRVYMATRRQPILEVPFTNFFSRPETLAPRLRKLKADVQSGRVDYLVYFNSDRANRVVTPRQLAESGMQLRKIGDYRDGEVWEVVRPR